jgi:putative Holliday junction resolvase
MGRILSLDYGKARTGVAVTDSLQLIAGGLATVATSTLTDFLTDYMKREEVECIVVGAPRQMNGQPSENMKRVEPFVNRIRKLFPTIEIVYYDERFTSVLAHRTMLDGGMKRMARRDKAKVDEISATIILQDFMESRRMGHA